MNKKKDILEKGAILQRDGETYAIVPDMKGGLCTPTNLRNIADVAEKYNAAALKITGAARIAIVGIQEDDIDSVWKDLDMDMASPIGLCVRSVKMCPGTDFCRLGLQNSIKIGMKLDELYSGKALPNKFKMGVSGCKNSCAESYLRDLGLIGSKKGWKVVIGGNAGGKPRIADIIAEELSDDEVLSLTDKIIKWYEKQPKRMRLSKLIATEGIEAVKKNIL